MRGPGQAAKPTAPIQQNKSPDMISDTQKSEMIRHFMSQVKTEDLLNVAFMKPFEVTLRTNRTDKTVPPDALPEGLMLVLKDNGINDNKYRLAPFKPVPNDLSTLDQLRHDNLDNYISLLKKPDAPEAPLVDEVRMSQAERVQEERPHKGCEFAICVSMAGEDRRILKKTLTGVAQNVDEMVRSGVSPDDIFVVVVIDGVQKVDKSLYEYFEEFERESETFLEEDDVLTLKKKYENFQYHQEIEKEEPLNFAKYLFKPEEFEQRVESKLHRVRAKYDQVLRIRKSIQNIKKEHNKDNDNLKMILNRMIDKQKDILKKINSQKVVTISEQTIMKELASSEEECNQYLSTRDSLAYVSAYRLPTSSLCTELKYADTPLTAQRTSLIEGQFETERMYDEQLMRRSGEEGESEESEGTGGRLVRKTIRYVNLFFCIKYKESGKLSSHNWFFNGFCQELRPKYTALVDVGVRPYKDALFKMYRCMKLNPRVGSVCGYLRLIEEKVEEEEAVTTVEMDCLSSMLSVVFDIQRAQQIENHFEHLIQKPFESAFKFIHALPGSFSAYSMEALRPTGEKDQMLREYFREMGDRLSTNKVVPSSYSGGEIITRVLLPKTLWSCGGKRLDPDSEEQLLYNENVNLAEDRVLCLGIHKNDKDIMYMPDVYAQVEPVKRINDLLGKKKKEVNGAAYSFQKVREQFAHETSKRASFFIRFQLFYLGFVKFISYFAPALLVFTLNFTFEILQSQFLSTLFQNESKKGIGSVAYHTFINMILFIYALLIFSILFFSLHLDYKSKRFIYYAYLVSTILGVFALLTFLVLLIQVILGFVGVGDYLRQSFLVAVQRIVPGNGLTLVNCLRYAMAGSVFVILFPIFIYAFAFGKFGILWDFFVGSLAYIFYFPTYAVVVPIYSRCHLDDITSAAGLGAGSGKLKETWKIIKLMDVSKYFFWNVVVSVALIIMHGYVLLKFFLMLFFLGAFVIIELIKIVPVLIYTISYKCSIRSNPLFPSAEEVEQSSQAAQFRIFNTIKKFEEDLKVEIQYSFELAAEDLEYQAQAAASKENKNGKEKEEKLGKEVKETKPATKQPQRLESLNRQTRQSIKIMQNFQGGKFANIRESSAVKGGYYPLQFNKRDKTGPSAVTTLPPPPAPLEMVLLQQQIGQEALVNNEMRAGEQKLKQYEIFRGTLARPVVK